MSLKSLSKEEQAEVVTKCTEMLEQLDFVVVSQKQFNELRVAISTSSKVIKSQSDLIAKAYPPKPKEPEFVLPQRHLFLVPPYTAGVDGPRKGDEYLLAQEADIPDGIL